MVGQDGGKGKWLRMAWIWPAGLERRRRSISARASLQLWFQDTVPLPKEPRTGKRPGCSKIQNPPMIEQTVPGPKNIGV